MNNFEFAEIAANIADGKYGATCYMLGPWGWPTTDRMITRATTQGSNAAYNMTQKPAALAIKNRGFIFDCVGLVKGILWGWDGDISRIYGGSTYASNGVPDIDAKGMINACKDSSADWSRGIDVGEVVWMDGHIGIYVGAGLVVEATPKWDGGVQVSALINIPEGKALGMPNARTWTKHGHLPYIEYVKDPDRETDSPSDWARQAWEAATKAGITDGTKPHDPATREQVIAMLYRCGVIR